MPANSFTCTEEMMLRILEPLITAYDMLTLMGGSCESYKADVLAREAPDLLTTSRQGVALNCPGGSVCLTFTGRGSADCSRPLYAHDLTDLTNCSYELAARVVQAVQAEMRRLNACKRVEA